MSITPPKSPLVTTRALAALFALALIGSGGVPVLRGQEQLPPEQTAAWKTWTYSLAVQAATWGGPLVTMFVLRNSDATGPQAKAPPNSIWRMEDISTPTLSQEAQYVSPNVNTIYGFGFMDLRAEPIVLTVPNSNNLYYIVEIVDMWTNAFAYIGGKATGYQGGQFALVGPGWQGTLPPGLKRIDCPTPWVLLQPRVHIYANGEVVLDRAKAVLGAIQPKSLSAHLGQPSPPTPPRNYPAPVPLDPSRTASALAFKDPLQLWELLSAALNENPPPADQVSALLPMFKPLGIELGETWDRTKVNPLVLAVMNQVAQDISEMLDKLPVGTIYQGAFIPPPTIGDSGTDYRTRAVVARNGLTANTPYEAIYWAYMLDSQGNHLTGTKRYTMTFKEGIPYFDPGFWSLTLYASSNHYTVSNSINRYMIGSDSKQLQKNSDGSFTLYIQAENPGPGKESNWLPAPAGEFYLIPRAYAPKPAAIGILTDVKSWPVPAVVPAP